MARARSSALVFLGAACSVAAACSAESNAPRNPGNDFDATTEDAAPAEEAGDDTNDASVFARVDSDYVPPPDSYVPFSWCSQCGCPSGTYCFGGGSGLTTFSGDCHADAGALTTAADLSIGCYPFPSACATQPSCECLIAAVAQFLPCYPVCSITTQIVYCPNP
jgi:hypothetical protein